jgi:hypothetical protein
MDHETIRDVISALSFAISVFLLFIHIRNRRTQLSSYHLARFTHRSSSIDLQFVGAEQAGDNILFKLVLFSPGSVATIIQSFAIFEDVQTRNPIRRLLWPNEWRRVEGARWWPTRDSTKKELRSMADEYENLYVEDFRTILALMPGAIDRRKYRFEIRTNNGFQTKETTIDGITIYFSHHFEQRFDER